MQNRNGSILNMRLLVVAATAALTLGLAGCKPSASFTALDATVQAQKIRFESGTLNLREGSDSTVAVISDVLIDRDLHVSISYSDPHNRLANKVTELTIPRGSAARSFVLSPVDDAVYMPPEVIGVQIRSLDEKVTIERDTMSVLLSDNELPTVQFTTTAISINEGAATAASLSIGLSAASDRSITAGFSVSGSAQPGDYTSASIGAGSVTFAPGETVKTISLQPVDDLLYEGNETVIVTLTTATFATVGTPASGTFTIVENDVGSFNVLGLRGGSDATNDAFLVDTLNPTVVGQTATGATQYRARIFSGTTELCSSTSATPTVAVTGCSLAQATSYTARLYAEDASGNSGEAANSPFTFRTNRSPAGGADGPIRIMKNTTATALPVTTTTAARGTTADSDADGDTLSVTAVTQGTAGGSVSFSGVTVDYTPPSATFTGIDTFTYTISDAYAGSTAVTVTMHVMDTYTWTGKISSTWSDGGNWCGSITNNACVGAANAPNNGGIPSHVARFDGTCSATGHSCDATFSGATQMYQMDLASTYTGTVTQAPGVGNTLTVYNGGYSQAGGKFVGGNAEINFSAYGNPGVEITGGEYTATSGIWYGRYSFHIGSAVTFHHNSGQLEFVGDCGCAPSQEVMDTGTAVLNSVNFNRAWGAGKIIGQLYMDGDLKVSSGGASYMGVTGGPIYVKGNVSFLNNNNAGSAPVIMNGSGTQTLSVYNSSITTGDITIAKSSGVVELGTDVTFRGTSQNLTITGGSLDMKGFNLTVTGTLALTSKTLTKSGGVLTVGGVTVGTGALYGGTVAP